MRRHYADQNVANDFAMQRQRKMTKKPADLFMRMVAQAFANGGASLAEPGSRQKPRLIQA